MIFCASWRAASICRCCSARMRAASSRSRLAPSIASSSAFSRASTAAVIFGNTKRPRITSRMMKTTKVQNISPPLGVRRSPDWVDSSGATWAACSSAKMKGVMLRRVVADRIREVCEKCEPDRGNLILAAIRTLNALELEFPLNNERDNDCEQRHSLDERGEDDRARLNPAGHLRLARHAVHRLSGQTSDTDAGADHGETGADARAEQAPCTRVLLRERGCGLKQRKHCYHFFTPSCVVISHARDLSIAVRQRDSPPN